MPVALPKDWIKKGIANAYNSIGVLISHSGQSDSATVYFQKALKIYKSIGYTKGIAISCFNIGREHNIRKNIPEALKNYGIALKKYQQIDDKVGIARCANNIGSIYLDQGKYIEALKSQLFALKAQQSIGDKSGAAYSFDNIGIIYTIQHNYPEALAHFIQALNISKAIKDDNILGLTCNNVGHVYHQLKNYDAALQNYYRALEIFKKSESQPGSLCVTYIYLGDAFNETGNYNEALRNYFSALKIAEAQNLNENARGVLLQISTLYSKQRNFKEAYKYAMKGLPLTQPGQLESLRYAYENLTEINAGLKNYKAAYESEVLFKKYYDSIFNKNNEKKLTQLQMQYNFDKKDAAAKAAQEKKDIAATEELRRQKLVRTGFEGGFAAMMLFAIVFFRQRNKISKEKKRSDELLLNILPSEVAEELKAKGNADARNFDNVTVMFTDFKGFTQISEKLTPVELVAEIHYCFKAFDEITTKYNIEKIKTIGDSYMCAGGLPVANKTNATDVVSAAIEIQQFMTAHFQQRTAENKEPFEIRIGVHTGPVVAGIVGVKKFAYDIWGDTVNIASRMESSGEAGKINISENTYEIIKDTFRCVHRGKIHAKNKGDIDMYFVEN